MKYFLLLLTCFSFSFFTCQNNQQENASGQANSGNSSNPLVGEWRSVNVRVDIADGKNSIFVATEQDWERKFNMSPIRTFFREDGTYNSEQYTLTDSLFLDIKGTWKMEGDQLTLFPTEPAPDTILCKVSINGKEGIFETMGDWDGDGQEDDKIFTVQRKL